MALKPALILPLERHSRRLSGVVPVELPLPAFGFDHRDPHAGRGSQR